jgi:hypothetical protein
VLSDYRMEAILALYYSNLEVRGDASLNRSPRKDASSCIPRLDRPKPR